MVSWMTCTAARRTIRQHPVHGGKKSLRRGPQDQMEVAVNQNRWFIEQIARYDQKQVQADMKQIRLAKSATKADHLAVGTANVRQSSSPGFRRFALTLSKAILSIIG